MRDAVPEFAAAVRAERERRGWSQGKVAALVGCGNSAVADIEREARAPSLGLAARLARVLGLRQRLAEFGAEKTSEKSPD